MRVLIDTNVLLDVALARPGLVEASEQVLAWGLRNPGTSGVAIHSLSTTWYILRRAGSEKQARNFISNLIAGVSVASIDHAGVERAIGLSMPDFEDALIASAALEFGATLVITRNLDDFRRSPVRAISPEEWVKRTAAQ
jgi:predicted nucleic acid-binding protein